MRVSKELLKPVSAEGAMLMASAGYGLPLLLLSLSLCERRYALVARAAAAATTTATGRSLQPDSHCVLTFFRADNVKIAPRCIAPNGLVIKIDQLSQDESS